MPWITQSFKISSKSGTCSLNQFKFLAVPPPHPLIVFETPIGSCQQRWPFFHAACFKLIGSLMCSFGGFSQTSLMGCQLRVARLFHRLGIARLACSYT